MFLGHNCWSLFSSKYIGPIILPQPQLHTPLLSTMNNTNKNITRAQKGVAGFLDSLSDFRPPLTLPPLVLHLFISHKRQAWAQFECIHLDNMLPFMSVHSLPDWSISLYLAFYDGCQFLSQLVPNLYRREMGNGRLKSNETGRCILPI